MSKVVLIAAPYLSIYGKLSEAAGRYFPLGLGYIASYLRKYGGHEVKLFEPEAQKLSFEDIATIIQGDPPDVVGITCSTPNFSGAIKLANVVRQNSSAKIVLGGPHASAIPEYIITKYPEQFDHVIVGEGEKAMLELVNALRDRKPVNRITGRLPFIEDLDSLPFPARDLIPQRLFTPNLHNARYRNCLTILTSRGCPFNCTFCAARIVSGKKYRTHSPEYVLAEMEMLKRDYQAEQLIITDDTFTMDHPRLEKICRGMIDRKLNLKWFCFSQVTTVNPAILKLMKQAGCYSIGFGIESSDIGILKRMGKPIDPQKAVAAVKAANDLDMKTQAFYILGSPDETREQMEQTIKFANQVDATLAFFNMLVPFPGTKDFDFYFSSIPLDQIHWDNFVAIGQECVLERSAVPPRDIEKMVGRANLFYYATPRRIMKLVWQIRTPYEFFNYLKGGAALFRQVGDWLLKK